MRARLLWLVLAATAASARYSTSSSRQSTSSSRHSTSSSRESTSSSRQSTLSSRRSASSARRPAVPDASEVSRQLDLAVRKYMFGVHVGWERARYNAKEITAIAIGLGAMFRGKSHPRLALLLQSSVLSAELLELLLPESIVVDLLAAACGAVLLELPFSAESVPLATLAALYATSAAELLSTLRRPAEPFGWVTTSPVIPTLAAALGLSQLLFLKTVDMKPVEVASALLGGKLVVEFAVQHFWNNWDLILIDIRPRVVAFLERFVLPTVRKLLPLPRLVRNNLNVFKTATQQATELLQEAILRAPLVGRLAACVAAAGASRLPVVPAFAKGLAPVVVDRQLDSSLQRLLPPALREQEILSTARGAAMGLAPVVVITEGYAALKAGVCRRWRPLLPFFLQWWGLAVQRGRVRPVIDSPRVLVRLLPMRWGDPLEWVLDKLRAYYRKVLFPWKQMIKAQVRAAIRFCRGLFGACFMNSSVHA